MEENKINDWSNLIDVKCPVCGTPLDRQIIHAIDYYVCQCDFRISIDKCTKILQEMQAFRPLTA